MQGAQGLVEAATRHFQTAQGGQMQALLPEIAVGRQIQVHRVQGICIELPQRVAPRTDDRIAKLGDEIVQEFERLWFQGASAFLGLVSFEVVQEEKRRHALLFCLFEQHQKAVQELFDSGGLSAHGAQAAVGFEEVEQGVADIFEAQRGLVKGEGHAALGVGGKASLGQVQRQCGLAHASLSLQQHGVPVPQGSESGLALPAASDEDPLVRPAEHGVDVFQLVGEAVFAFQQGKPRPVEAPFGGSAPVHQFQHLPGEEQLRDEALRSEQGLKGILRGVAEFLRQPVRVHLPALGEALVERLGKGGPPGNFFIKHLGEMRGPEVRHAPAHCNRGGHACLHEPLGSSP